MHRLSHWTLGVLRTGRVSLGQYLNRYCVSGMSVFSAYQWCVWDGFMDRRDAFVAESFNINSVFLAAARKQNDHYQQVKTDSFHRYYFTTLSEINLRVSFQNQEELTNGFREQIVKRKGVGLAFSAAFI